MNLSQVLKFLVSILTSSGVPGYSPKVTVAKRLPVIIKLFYIVVLIRHSSSLMDVISLQGDTEPSLHVQHSILFIVLYQNCF